MSLPYWFEDLDNLFYIPESKVITLEQAYADYGISSTEIMQCKAWWNTNITMDKFVPTLIPAMANQPSSTCLLDFVERVKQRAEGKMCPSPPELKLMPGIIVYEKNLDVIGMYVHLPSFAPREVKFMQLPQPSLSGSWIAGEVISRNLDYLYWDMIEEKYV